MTPALTDLGNRLATYLSHVWEEPLVLSDIEQIPGGASRETYRVQLARGAEQAPQGVILRPTAVSTAVMYIFSEPVPPAGWVGGVRRGCSVVNAQLSTKTAAQGPQQHILDRK